MRRLWTHGAFPAALLISLLTACTATTGAGRSSVLDKVWQETIVDIMGRPPLSIHDLLQESVPVEGKMPAVVYLHGCGGRGNTAHSHIRFFKLQGFAVFAPDHFSRRGAKTQCDANKGLVWASKSTRDKRVQEARVVRERLRSLDWIDQNRVYLVGHSQGGWAAAHYGTSGDFSGIIVIASACGEGIQHHTSMLTIAAKDDEFALINKSTPCATYSGRKVTHLVVQGGDHNFIMDSSYLAQPEKQARDAILAFLESTRSQQ